VAVRSLAKYIEGLPDVELCHQPDTGIICFRMRPSGVEEQQLDHLQQSLYDRTLSEGQRAISVTRIGGKSVLRLVSVSPMVTFTDLRETIEALRHQSSLVATHA
jgi:L-2,4-diaminobutyrate decarboxylase